MRLWRIANALYPVWSAEGARLKGGRWNRPGTPAIYASASYASAVLEILVHANISRVPPTFRVVTADLPDDAQIDRLMPSDLPGWDTFPPAASCDYGNRWLRARQGLVLLVPSVVTGGMDLNVMINPLHPDFAQITISAEEPVRLDPRLFPVPAGRV
jgi:RES domain-containing protein